MDPNLYRVGDGEDSPIVRYVQTVITEALNRRASDIHMEPLETRFRIRFRIDGVLHEIENPPKTFTAYITFKN